MLLSFPLLMRTLRSIMSVFITVETSYFRNVFLLALMTMSMLRSFLAERSFVVEGSPSLLHIGYQCLCSFLWRLLQTFLWHESCLLLNTVVPKLLKLQEHIFGTYTLDKWIPWWCKSIESYGHKLVIGNSISDGLELILQLGYLHEIRHHRIQSTHRCAFELMLES